jgi:hypothetical protein
MLKAEIKQHRLTGAWMVAGAFFWAPRVGRLQIISGRVFRRQAMQSESQLGF